MNAKNTPKRLARGLLLLLAGALSWCLLAPPTTTAAAQSSAQPSTNVSSQAAAPKKSHTTMTTTTTTTTIRAPQTSGKPASDATSGASSNKVHKNATSVGVQSQNVDELLHETLQLLDALDKKVASVGSRTPSAMMKDQLRLLQVASGDGLANAAPMQPSGVQNSTGLTQLAPSPKPKRLAANDNSDNNDRDSAESELALVKLAEAFSSDRRPVVVGGGGDEPLINAESVELAAASDASSSSGGVAEQTRSGRQVLAADEQAQQPTTSTTTTTTTNYLPETDSTEQHIRFTLDLMQAIFSSQSYTSKTNSIESFLISPLSIQTVLMMMHLGARGATRRELAHCLHLPAELSSSDWSLSSSSSSSSSLSSSLSGHSQHAQQVQQQAAANQSKLKRRHQSAAGAGATSGAQKGAAAAPGAAPAGATGRPAAQRTKAQSHQQQQQQQQQNVHETFGSAVRNLLKDQSVMKALTSANQIFVQRSLPVASGFEWALRHYYAAEARRVDFVGQRGAPAAAFAADATTPLGPPTSNASQTAPAAAPHNSESSSSSSSAAAAAAADGPSQPQPQPQPQQTTDVQALINEWIERQTKGRILNFLSAPVPQSTLLIAINALYLKGDWQYKFDVADTEADAVFSLANGETVRVPMMVNKLPLAYAHDAILRASVIELPYKAQRLGLFLLLPDEINGIFHTMQHLNSTTFANLISAMRKQAPLPNETGSAGGINVRVPKFTLESSPRLSQILTQQLGVKTLFSADSANLSGMFASAANVSSHHNKGTITTPSESPPPPPPPQQVGLDELVHKAVLQVDESGSVAAASSATIVERVGLFNGNYFEADHPFLLFLMDKQTGLVLFSGAFAGPSRAASAASAAPGAHTPPELAAAAGPARGAAQQNATAPEHSAHNSQ